MYQYPEHVGTVGLECMVGSFTLLLRFRQATQAEAVTRFLLGFSSETG